MDGAIRAPVVAGHGLAQSGTVVTAAGVVIGVIVGVALALLVNALTDADIAEIGPFNAPTEMCRFNMFNPPELVPVVAAQSALPTMVSKCSYLFKDREYIQVGYRI